MEIDPSIEDAIAQAVADADQPPSLASKISAWFASLVSGNDSLDSEESVRRRMDVLLSNIEVDIESSTQE